jgi:RNA polymerase sigma-70 factor, ECF subfamily
VTHDRASTARPAELVVDQRPRSHVDLVDAARAGDEDAFRTLIDPHRAELQAYCRRMLGSQHDAEDAVQEAIVRAWKALAGLRDPERLRSWLYAITNNAALDLMKRRRMRPRIAGWDRDAEGALVKQFGSLNDLDRSTPESRYELRESITDAFALAMTQLSRRQRTVLVLREVLRYSAREVAQLLDTTVPAVNSALQRARIAANVALSAWTDQPALSPPGGAYVRFLAERCTDAFEVGDVDKIVAVLSSSPTRA